jgi:predicted amino acid dehydrogenase
MKCANIIKIGVILHPLNMMDFQKRFYSFYFPYSMFLWPIVKNINPYRLKQFFSTFPTHLVFSTNVFEYTGKRIQILAAMCPVFPEQLIRNREFGVNRIKDGLKLLSNKGAKVITLAGFTSIVSNGGKDVILNISSAVTSGNSLTAALTIEGIEKKVILKGLNLNELTLAVIGATGDIGSICSLYFAKKYW